MSENKNSSVYKKAVEVLLTEKQYRYLEVVNMMKGKKGISVLIRDIIEEYRRNHEI